jgi:hypothetical protein
MHITECGEKDEVDARVREMLAEAMLLQGVN